MIKKTLLSMAGLLTLTSLSTVFAEAPNCFPPQLIQSMNVQFTQAIQNPSVKSQWFLMSDAIPLNGSNWNVWFAKTFMYATTPAEALQEGQSYFNSHKSNIGLHKSSVTDGKTVCAYGPPDNVSPTDAFFVAVFNPPQYGFDKSLLK